LVEVTMRVSASLPYPIIPTSVGLEHLWSGLTVLKFEKK